MALTVVDFRRPVGMQLDAVIELVRAHVRQHDGVFTSRGRVMAAVTGDAQAGLAVAGRLRQDERLRAAGVKAILVDDLNALADIRPIDLPLGGRPASTDGEPGAFARVVVTSDYDGAVRPLLRRLLETEGWAVLDGWSPKGVTAPHREGQPNLIVIDADMPDSAGIELIRSLRDHHEPLPVLFFAGRPGDDVAAAVKELGAHMMPDTTVSEVVDQLWSMVPDLDGPPARRQT